MRIQFLLAALALHAVQACAPLPPSPADLEAKRFEPAPDKGVIYVFRNQPDFVDDGAPITVNGHIQGTTYPGTYLRLELAPGRHRIAGFAGDAGWIDVDAVPGEVRFVQQAVIRSFIGPAQSRFRFVDPHYGRHAVLRHELVGAR